MPHREVLQTPDAIRLPVSPRASLAVAVATDMPEGVIDRLETMPVARSSVIVGRAVANVIIGLPSLAVMIVCALAVGSIPEAGVGDARASDSDHDRDERADPRDLRPHLRAAVQPQQPLAGPHADALVDHVPTRALACGRRAQGAAVPYPESGQSV